MPASKRKRQAPSPARTDVPSAVPAWITPELIQATIETWQPFYPESITPEDAVIMLINAGRMFSVLSRG